ncbi:hypothetical protein OS187_08830 [Xanthomonadaceae bacterium JHOS43]|jgi:hypothetical protein|nr:hypothetical protein [Xanthomonadaceae bacterium JHOS43]MCX7562514.1 hypothetical protein [Xanthomonadaceae bacterium XH05]
MSDHLLLALCAAHSLLFAAFHLAFWRLFRWRESLPRMKRVDRAILQILNLRLSYVFLGIGGLCLCFPNELVDTALGRTVMLGMTGFWLGRLVEQFVFLRVNHAGVHALSALMVLGTLLFAWPPLRALLIA